MHDLPDSIFSTLVSISNKGFGLEAIEAMYLMEKRRIENMEFHLGEKENALIAIKKINNGKNEAIDSICETCSGNYKK